MSIKFEKKNKIGIIEIEGRLDATNAKELKEGFSNYLKETNLFVMDCHQMDYLDSTGLGAIVACLKYVSEAEGDLFIANLQAKPRMVFEITRAYKIFDVFDSVDAAVEALETLRQ